MGTLRKATSLRLQGDFMVLINIHCHLRPQPPVKRKAVFLFHTHEYKYFNFACLRFQSKLRSDITDRWHSYLEDGATFISQGQKCFHEKGSSRDRFFEWWKCLITGFAAWRYLFPNGLRSEPRDRGPSLTLCGIYKMYKIFNGFKAEQEMKAAKNSNCCCKIDLLSSWKWEKNKDRLRQPTAPQHNYGS